MTERFGTLTAEAHDADLLLGDAQELEVTLRGACPAIAERHVVFGRAPLVAMALDPDRAVRALAVAATC